MKYIFIEGWISCDGKFKYVQLIENDRFSQKIKSTVIPVEKLNSIYIDHDETIYNFKINSGIVYAAVDIPQYEIDEEFLLEALNNTYVLDKPCRTIYDLLVDLMDNNEYLASDKILDRLDCIEDNICRILPQVSNSTMSVYSSCISNGYWSSKKFVYAEGNKLNQNSFYVFVKDPKQYPELELVKDSVSIFDELYCLMKYNCTLPIYVYNHSDVTVFSSLINQYSYMSFLSDTFIKAARFLKTMYCDNEEPVAKSSSNSVRKLNLSNNVTFKHSIKPYTKNKLEDLNHFVIDTILREYAAIQDKSVISKNLQTLDSIDKNICMYFVVTRLKSNFYTNKYHLLDLCNQEIEMYRKIKLKYDLFLYAFRTDIFTFDIGVVDGEIKTYKGGAVSSTTSLVTKVEVV